MRDLRALRPTMPILLGASLALSIGMGVRQSLGLLMPPLTRELAISVSDFTFAIAMQNLAWGLLQSIAGAMVVRVGFRPVMLVGAALYCAGLLSMTLAQGAFGIIMGAGVLLGMGLACTASAIALAVAARAAPPRSRSLVLGVVTAAGSIGPMVVAPIVQSLAGGFGWRAGAVTFLALALAMLPAAWLAGGVDRIALSGPTAGIESASAGAALRTAMGKPTFLVMAAAYFVCGLQLVFLTTHLPSYLAICGMDPMLSAEALGVIGAFNIVGSIFFGWAGGRWSKQVLLGILYTARSFGLLFYFMLPPTPLSTLIFAGVMGFLWLGVGPLIAGSVVEMFGLRWQAMIQGIAFMSHQIGSFLGAFGGGLLFDRLGSYDLAWRLVVGMGLTAGIIQILFALPWPRQPRLATG